MHAAAVAEVPRRQDVAVDLAEADSGAVPVGEGDEAHVVIRTAARYDSFTPAVTTPAPGSWAAQQRAAGWCLMRATATVLRAPTARSSSKTSHWDTRRWRPNTHVGGDQTRA